MDDLDDIIEINAQGSVSASALLPDCAELHCLSNFSFLCGASHPQELAATALEHGYTAIAITDECSLAGVVRTHSVRRDPGYRSKSESRRRCRAQSRPARCRKSRC